MICVYAYLHHNLFENLEFNYLFCFTIKIKRYNNIKKSYFIKDLKTKILRINNKSEFTNLCLQKKKNYGITLIPRSLKYWLYCFCVKKFLS